LPCSQGLTQKPRRNFRLIFRANKSAGRRARDAAPIKNLPHMLHRTIFATLLIIALVSIWNVMGGP